MRELDETQIPISSPQTLTEVVIVGPIEENVIRALERVNAEVFYSSDGFEYLDRDPVFVFSDFLSQPFMNLQSMARGSKKEKEGRWLRIVGPPYILHLAATLNRIPLPPRNRPRFSYHMAGVHVAMDLKENLKKEVIDKLHWMSASVRKELSQQTSHFIGDSVISETCRKVASLGKPLIRYLWVAEAWEHVNDVGFDPMEKSFIENYYLGCFEGLSIYFFGFSEDEIKERSKIALSKKAVVVTDPDIATHIIYEANSENEQAAPNNFKAWHVTDKWFWESVGLGRALTENTYPPNSRPIERQLTSTALHGSKSSILNNSNSSMLSNGEKSTGSPCKADKKQMIVLEMLQTERNYIECLQLLISMKEKLVGTKENDAASWIAKNPQGNITVADANMIFGKIAPILNAHKALSKDLNDLVNNWSSRSAVGPVWLGHIDVLSKVYPPFINTFDVSKEHFQRLDAFEHFHAFVRACEADEKWRRQRVMDILVRPVQRMHQVFLLLEQCAKACKKNSSDFDSLSKACRRTQELLKNANESRRTTEEYEKNCRVFDEIENMPPELRSSQRLLVAECVVVCLGGLGDWQEYYKKPLRLLIFNDVFVIAKKRPPPTGTISRMARHFSTTSLLGDRRKPYKFISFYSFNSGIRRITTLNDQSGANDQLFMMVLRHNEKGDEEVLVGVDEYFGYGGTNVYQCMVQLSKCVFLETGRENILEKVSLQKLPQSYSEDIVRQPTQPIVGESEDSKENINCTGIVRKTGLRKALSNTSVFRRLHTHPLRGQVNSILEESIFSPTLEVHNSVSSPLPSRIDFATPQASPRRGLGPKIQSASNFFTRTFRKPSFRRIDQSKLEESTISGKYTQI